MSIGHAAMWDWGPHCESDRNAEAFSGYPVLGSGKAYIWEAGECDIYYRGNLYI